MCPILHLRLFGICLDIASYGFFTALAAVAGAILAIVMLRRERLGFLRSLLLLVVMAACFLIFARLWNFLANTGGYGKGLTLFSFRLAGFSLYGGILGAFIAFLIVARFFRRSPWPLLDALVLPAAVAFSLARVGCFLNGCCGGVPTRTWLGVHFPARPGSSALPFKALPLLGSIDLPVYPTQLFELALALLGLIPALLLYLRKKAPDGVPFLVYGVWFTAMRWGVLYFREMPYPEYVVHIIYPAIYAILIACGVFELIYKLRRRLPLSPAGDIPLQEGDRE
jgi:phosphatidylglycerol---prolipoprotein diacylglyceryl transferase